METAGSSSEKAELPCPICQTLTTARCSACKQVAYCSRDHQKAHWKVHKGECHPWKICEAPNLGRYLQAVRDIKAGEVVLAEMPLVLTPPKLTPPVCPGCYIEFEDDAEPESQQPGTAKSAELKNYEKFAQPHPCPRGCGWPNCGKPECMDSLAHEPECRAGASKSGLKIRNFGQDHPTYEAIGVLRVLALKSQDPEAYANFMSLEGHQSAKGKQALLLHDAAELIEERKRSWTRAVSLVKDFFRCPDVTKEEVQQIMSIIETNGHEIPVPDLNGQLNRRLIGVYHNSSFLEHNCIPNCVKTWETGNKEIRIRASVPIKKGEHLSISYVDPLWGTADRLNFLEMSKLFTCRCTRCLDPTELGTHVSSIRCRQLSCMNQLNEFNTMTLGLVSATDPLAMDSEWRCGTCGETYPPAAVASIVEKVGRDLEALHEKYGNLEAQEEFIKKYSKVLSPNHFYLLELKLGLAQVYGRLPDEPLHNLHPTKLLRKRVLCEQLLQVFNKMVPGYNRLRGIILYELQACVGTLSKLRRAVEEISVETHREELMQCVQWMAEVIKVLAWEPENSVERRRAEGAVQELLDLRELLTSDYFPPQQKQA